MRGVWSVFGIVGLTLGLRAADPYVGYIYPAGVQAGTTNRLLVGGQNFWGVKEAGVTGPGVKVLKVERMVQSAPPTSSQRAWLKKWLDGIIERGDRTPPARPTNETARVSEWTSNAWWSALGRLDRKALEAVERDIYVRKNPLQMSPALRQILFVDVAVDANAPTGRHEFCVWTPNGISPPRPLYVTSAPHVAEPLYRPPHRKSVAKPPVVSAFPAVLDGRILPGETDRFRLVLEKGRTYHIDACARELQPYVGDAVPGFFNATLRLCTPDGRECAFSDDRARFLPDPELVFTAPTNGTYGLEIRDNLFRGREDFVYAVSVKPMRKSAAGTRCAACACTNALAVGGQVSGCIQAGTNDVYAVDLKGPGTFAFDLAARRNGSSLDGVLTLTDDRGRRVWRQDDVTNELFIGSIAQAECDARGCVTLAKGERKRYEIAVSDLTGHGGEGYGYTLTLRRERPDFAVYAARSSFLGRPNARSAVTLHVVRTGGFTGPVTLLETDAYRFENTYFPPGTNCVKAQFVSKCTKAGPLRTFRVRAFAEPGGVPTVHDVVPADAYDQAFAWRHLLTVRAFLVKPCDPWPAPARKRKSAR